MSRGLNRSEEWLAETELRLKAQNKQKDVHLDKPKQFTKNEKAKLKIRGIKPVVRIPTEHEEQCAVIQWCDQHPIAKHIFAIPNGSHKSPAMAAKFKREGLRPGVPDLFLPVPCGGWNGFFIEMKRSKRSVTSETQKNWHSVLFSWNFRVQICEGADEAIAEIKHYLESVELN